MHPTVKREAVEPGCGNESDGEAGEVAMERGGVVIPRLRASALLTGLIVWVGPGGLQAADLDRTARVEVERILYQDCGSCHGGQLTGGLGPSLRAPRVAAYPEDLIRDTIRFGRTGTPMPPWEGVLSPAQIDHLVELIRGLEVVP